MSSPCGAPGCSRPSRATGLCASHYAQARRGRALRPLRRDQDLDRVQVMLPAAVAGELGRIGRGAGGVSAAARAILIDWYHSRRK